MSCGFDRGTPAGNLVYNLYNKKNMDSTLDPELLARVKKFREEKEQQEKPKVKPIPKSRAHVNVPKPRGPTYSAEQIALAKLSSVGARRRAGDILRAQAEETTTLTIPEKPLLGEGEKMKLQHVMEYGELPQPPRAIPDDLPRPSPLTIRFEELKREVTERREFLQRLQADRLASGPTKLCGDMDKHEKKLLETKLLREIEEYLEEMRRVDKMLSCD